MSRSSRSLFELSVSSLLVVPILVAPLSAIGDEAPHADARIESGTGARSIESGSASRATLDAMPPTQRRMVKGKPVIRCWQEGRLVFESSGLLPVGKTQAAIELRSANDGNLLVVDLRQGLCIVETPPGA